MQKIEEEFVTVENAFVTGFNQATAAGHCIINNLSSHKLTLVYLDVFVSVLVSMTS
ncbi:hypothetical protein TUM17387_26000 [Shewanella carassii]|uniref:Uncharacterized protein n=1 Tax=Shewanella carassii TaxID=1987584 RepID=A0ABQ1T0V3_9GAMM|nr:hypothetical protein TUM17387_26000 [Shewanella carassii]GGE77855.1 hypothetical protein GCM10011520_17980 [Shewanella carassii]